MMAKLKLSREKLIRIVSDIVLINLSLIVGLSLRFYWIVLFHSEVLTSGDRNLLQEYIASYTTSSWLLTAFCLISFMISGFYNYGRAYQGRYKLVVVAQAISIGYLLYAFFAYFLMGGLGMPRGTLVLAWGLSVVLLTIARVWSTLWTRLVFREQQKIPLEKRVIRRILVIGGAGYIGSALLPKLLNQGYKVRLLDLLMYGTGPLQGCLHHPNLEIVKADFRQIDQIVEAMRDVDAVIHLGGLVGDPACAVDEELTVDINLTATRTIAEVAKGYGVHRFLFASTCSVYGAGDEILHEQSELRPVSLYARSKIASERVLTDLADEHFVPTILRFGTIYGLSGRTRFDLVINLLTAKALVDGKITVFGGDQWRPFVHVDDAALAVFKALEAPLPLVQNQVFNVGSDGQNYTIQQIGELIHKRIPEAELLNMGSDTDKRDYRVDFRKIHNRLGFSPQWTVEQGIEQVSQAIRSGKVENYLDSQYNNVKFLTEAGLSQLATGQHRWAHELINTVTEPEDNASTSTDEQEHRHNLLKTERVPAHAA